jgi:hypothetical protein
LLVTLFLFLTIDRIGFILALPISTLPVKVFPDASEAGDMVGQQNNACYVELLPFAAIYRDARQRHKDGFWVEVLW